MEKLNKLGLLTEKVF